jgi:hypothetical protein
MSAGPSFNASATLPPVSTPSASVHAPAGLPLPTPGILGSASNPSTQLGQAQSLFNTAKAALASQPPDPAAMTTLLGAGVTLALSAVGGSSPGATIARTLVTAGTALASGAAVGGPWGAAVGAVAALAQGIAGLFSGYQGVVMSPSQAAQELYQLRVQWVTSAGNVGRETQKPMGWSFTDYLSAKYPPSSTTRLSDLKTLLGAALESLWDTAQTLGVTLFQDPAGVGPIDGGYSTLASMQGALAAGTFAFPFIAHELPLGQQVNASDAISWATENDVGSGGSLATLMSPLATPIFFLWGNPSQIQDVTLNEYLTSETPMEQLETLWANDTQPIASGGKNLSVAAIQASAEARRPDPMYFSGSLYVMQEPNHTVFYNLELLTMVSTVTGMLAVGASTASILRELLFQQKAIYDQEGNTVPAGCRMLVEDYLALAHAEAAHPGQIITMQSLFTSTGAPSVLSTMSKASAGSIIASFIQKYLGR